MTPALESSIKSYLSTNPPGWCWEAKALAMAESVLTSRAPLIVEVGVFGGRSLIPLALAAKSLPSPSLVIGIDPWQKDSALEALDPVTDAAHISWWSTVDLEAVQARAWRDLITTGLGSHCALLRTSSTLASRLFPPLSISLLHIDGCHVREVAIRDVTTWLPLCRPGALVWMDDTNWASTQEAVRLLESSCSHLLTIPDPATGSETRLFQKRYP
jgi:hypothetical protein